MHIAVRNAMLADASVVALFGQKVHWADVPKGEAFPHVRMQQVSERRSFTLDGDDGIGRHLIQFDAFAEFHRDAREARKAMIKLWSAHSSDEIAGAFIRNIRETVERGAGDKDVIYRVSLDILVIVKETEDE